MVTGYLTRVIRADAGVKNRSRITNPKKYLTQGWLDRYRLFTRVIRALRRSILHPLALQWDSIRCKHVVGWQHLSRKKS